MDTFKLNQQAWDRQVALGESPWTQPVGEEEIAAARRDDWQVILTPNTPVPRAWFGDVRGKVVLGLASGGGQQVPILAAAGAKVVSFDASRAQLDNDVVVARRHNLDVRAEQGDMRDLNRFGDGTFDLIFHPVSNVFVADVLAVWHECYRVLKPGGRLLAGFMNPSFFLFDHEALDADPTAPPVAAYALPYADLDHLTDAQAQARVAGGEGLEFSHSLTDQIGGQLAAGLRLLALFEDDWDDAATPLNRLMPTSIATLAEKPLDI